MVRFSSIKNICIELIYVLLKTFVTYNYNCAVFGPNMLNSTFEDFLDYFLHILNVRWFIKQTLK